MISVSLIFHLLLIVFVVTDAFVSFSERNGQNPSAVLLAKEDGDGESKAGYRFGDITRGLLKRSSTKKNGDGESKDGYRFGDITRGLIKKSSSYKFGDITRGLVSSLEKNLKEQVISFTKKDNYKFGDLSKEVVRRLQAGEYTRDDLFLFLKIIATIGINLQPVTNVLPLKVLTDLLNMTMEASIAQSVGNKVTSAIANEIDGRVKEMLTGDRNYEVGNLTKNAISKWTGKDTYEFGDITKTFLAKRAAATDDDKISGNASLSNEDESFELFSSKSQDGLLEEWDEKLLKARREKEGMEKLKNDESYKEWDEKFLSSSSSA